MNRLALFSSFRNRVDDSVAPFRWSDDLVQEYLDDAEMEAAARAMLLKDTTTAGICTVQVFAGVAEYMLDPRILSVERAKLDSQNVPLDLTSTEAIDRRVDHGPHSIAYTYGSTSLLGVQGGGWEQATGSPRRLALDDEGGRWKARLIFIPTENDVLRLTVFRQPLRSISQDTDSPEIPYRLHARLVDWMEHRAYLRRDTETFNSAEAVKAEQRFSQSFGERIDANARRKQEDLTDSTVQFRF